MMLLAASLLLFGGHSVATAGVSVNPFYIRLPSVLKNGSLDYGRMRHATMYLSQSAKEPGKIIGRASGPAGTVFNDSRMKQTYERANVGSTVFNLEVRFTRSIYTVHMLGAIDFWAIGDPR